LTCCPYSSKEDGRNSEGKIGIGHHDGSVIASKLQKNFPESVLYFLSHFLAYVLATRE
jgi:hypothetical protein